MALFVLVTKLSRGATDRPRPASNGIRWTSCRTSSSFFSRYVSARADRGCLPERSLLLKHNPREWGRLFFTELSIYLLRARLSVCHACQNGSRIPVPKPVFVTSGTSPAGSMWSRMPIPGSGYGHRCACDLTDDDHGDRPQVLSAY
jgi:hypothetical protein